MRECIPLVILLKKKLKYALTSTEVKKIVRDRDGLIKVDHRVRRDPRFPCGFMDVISCDKTGENFRMLYDVKGKYIAHPINAKEAEFKLCKVKKLAKGANAVPYLVTNDGRNIRFPHPAIKVNDTIKLNLETGEIEVWYRFESGATVMINGGSKNIGRIGIIQNIQNHESTFDIVTVKDPRNKVFATRADNVFVIGEGKKTAISIPKGAGIRYTVIEEKEMRAEDDE